MAVVPAVATKLLYVFFKKILFLFIRISLLVPDIKYSFSFLQVHDSSDTASAGSPANTISSTTPATASTTTSAPLNASFSQTTDQKVGEKVSDISVVSLGTSSTVTSQPLSTAPASSNREDYDSSATVRPTFLSLSNLFIKISIVNEFLSNQPKSQRLRGPSDRDSLLVPGDGGRRSGRC